MRRKIEATQQPYSQLTEHGRQFSNHMIFNYLPK